MGESEKEVRVEKVVCMIQSRDLEMQNLGRTVYKTLSKEKQEEARKMWKEKKK